MILRSTAKFLIVPLVLHVFAASAADVIGFSDSAVIPAAGIRMPLMRYASAVPLKPPAVYMYTLRRGPEEWKEERYDVREMWYASQYIAAWKDRDGNCLTVGRITAVLPSGLDDGHVTLDKFREVIASPASSADELDSGSLRKWVRDFTMLDAGNPEPLNINRGRLSEVYRFPYADPRTLIYAVRFDPSRTGNETAAERMLVFVAVTSGLNPEKDVKSVESGLIGKLAALGRFEGRPDSQAGKSGTGAAVRMHPSRESAHQSIANQEDWWYLDSEDYVVLSNSRSARKFAVDLLEDMQLARAYYSRILPPGPESLDDVSVIRIFNTGEEYVAYVGEEHKWTSGIFDPMRRELVIKPPSESGRGSAYKKTLAVALHEGFHQYDFFASGGRQSSAWYNEGFASFFEVMEIGGRKITVGENRMRAQTVEQIVKDGGSSYIAPLLLAGYPEFYAGSDGERQAKYAIAWALAYYLERGAPQERNDPYGKILVLYRDALRKTGDERAATAAAFEGVDISKFQRDFDNFWKTPRRRQTALRDAR